MLTAKRFWLNQDFNPYLQKITLEGIEKAARRYKGGYELRRYYSCPYDGDFYALVFKRDGSYLDIVVDPSGNVKVAVGVTGTVAPNLDQR